MKKLSHKQISIIFLSFILLSFLFITLNIMMGAYPIAFIDVVKTLFRFGTPDDFFIIHELRVPRALVAFLAGAALALSGALLQGLSRNILASPEIVGINSGASLAAVFVIVFSADIPVAALPLATFTGGFIAAMLTYILGWKKGSSSLRLILVGIGITALANALVTFMIINGNILQVTQATIWMTGSVYGRGWQHFAPLFFWLVIFVPLALTRYRQLNILQLNVPVVKGLGVLIEKERFIILFLSVALAAIAVAMVGPIGFVGLMAPHIAREIIGVKYQLLLPLSLLVGGCIVVASDLVGRIILMPYEIPAGIITSILGAPYFIYLLIRKKSI